MPPVYFWETGTYTRAVAQVLLFVKSVFKTQRHGEPNV